jgi:hypothetical protein
LDGLRAVLTSPTYKEKVFPDEKTFLDHGNTLILVGDRVQIIPDQAEPCPTAGEVDRGRSARRPQL